MIDDLELEEVHATAIIQKAIDFDVYTDDMPSTKKDKMEAAHDIVAFAIDSWVNDGMRPDSEDEGEAQAGKMIEEIFEIAGVEIDDDDEVSYGDPADMDVDGTAEDDGEAPVDIEDIIEGYEELTAATRLKKIKALELDPEDDDDYNTLVSIAEWEEAQDKPSSRVLDYLNDIIPADDDGKDGDDEGDGDGDDEPWDEKSLAALDKDELADVAKEFDVEMPKRLTAAGKKRTVEAILEAQEADEDGDGDNDGDTEEPWDGYDDTSIKDIKSALEEAQEDEEDPLTSEQLALVIAYEEANENRKSLVKWLNELAESLEDGDGDDELDEDSLMEMEPDELEEIAGEYEVDFPDGKLTTVKRKKVVKAILEAAEEGDDDDNGGDEDDEPEEKKPARRGRRGAKTSDPDDDDAADEAKAKDDRKDAKKGKGGTLILSRDDIIEALTKGEVEIELG